MKRVWAVAVCAAAAAACGDRAAEAALREGRAAAPHRDSVDAAQATLLAESMAVMEFVGELNNELARAGRLRVELSSGAAGESKIAEAKREREALADRVRDILAHLDSSEARLDRAQKQVRQLAGRESALTARVTALAARLDSIRSSAMTEQQALHARISALEGTVATLAADTARLAARVAGLSDSVNTVYYIAATEQELLERGVIVREGGRRYLFAGPRSIHPARRLPPQAFKALDMTKARTIPLPPGQYKIVSRHSLDLLRPDTLDGGKVGGTLRVTAPDEFWGISKFLILVRA
jgi:predicted  nucleic acid-binding Zn-ribbon protein